MCVCMYFHLCDIDAEIQHSMSLVCVPLDVEDTLSCYHQALTKRPHSLHVFQHSRTLLLQLLAFTQPSEYTCALHANTFSQQLVKIDTVPPLKALCGKCCTRRTEVSANQQAWSLSVPLSSPLQTSNLAT